MEPQKPELHIRRLPHRSQKSGPRQLDGVTGNVFAFPQIPFLSMG
jgi:hypothetical protein